MTDTRATQASVEQWLKTNPNAQATQISVEHWASVSSGSVQAIVTQVAIEYWASVASVSTARNGPIVTMIG
jgi:hypothetical protein